MRLSITLVTLVSYYAVSVSAAPSCTVTAAGAGKDDAPALLAAVQACPTTIIPVGTTLNISTRLDMTGLSNKEIKLQGTIRFNPNIPYWSGNGFSYPFQTQVTFWQLGGTNLHIDGGGTLDGAGQAWYDAFKKNGSLLRPILLTVYKAKTVVIENIKMVNPPEWFNFVNEGTDITYNNLNLSAVSTNSNPAKNTDGWDIYRSDTVKITNCNINNGDDCVAFKPNATNIFVNNLLCNGSHGISVGSLGQYKGVYDIVQNVVASNIRISNAENGARVKAWAGQNVGSGLVKNVTFSGFTQTNNANPVIIDQCYETSASACTQYPSNVYISGVSFNGMSGTASKTTVASILCSPDNRCSGVAVNNFNLIPPAKKGAAKYACQNVALTGNAASLFGTCATT
ncbi:glycoside hydrolase family 28 protein [Rickenella mellea]|uniref:galacturonan 1,4-alpha-galacturonidase n=1 Tax=Rickenella mellea TaxID=50990 RepID=A0A4Y7Q7Y4_9AGAM|nr:glycoside hydrolase family 28 protein [Rickenella mellea]